MMFEDGEYYYSPNEVFSTCLSSFKTSSSSHQNGSSKKKMMNKRRFSDEQVRSLESIFENETKLEPKKKVQVAKELGLQPRQVAIWFQNKRARYKSKQLERDFALLRANYNALATQFESLKKEKHALFLQLKKLKDEMAGKKPEDQNQESKEDHEEDEDQEEQKAKKENETNKKGEEELWESKPAVSMEGSEYGGGGASMLSSSDEGSSANYANPYYFDDQNDNMLTSIIMEPNNNNNNTEEACWDDYPPPPPDQCLFDKQEVDSSAHWWDFWS